MAMTKIVDGVEIQLTTAEEAARTKEENDYNNDFDRIIKEFRDKRNKLLIETDFYGYSDVTMSSDMTTYRQALRDLPSGLDTVEKVKAKEFPTKPE